MNFTTIAFLAFLPIVFSLYWLVRRRSQNALLIVASYTFYGWWDYRFCFLMFASSLVDFAIGWTLDSTENARHRRWLLSLSLVANVGLLGVFKYFNFFADSFEAIAQSVGWSVSGTTLNIILPVGISFYTFQTMSYTIDVYRRQLKPTKDLIDYLAFVSFFPQLVAGPIERASNLLPQFARARSFDPVVAREGCRQILWGFVKKLLIADRLAVIVNEHYSNPGDAGGVTLALATVCFAFQIYCDFSAYSDIAIGTAKLFNIRLMRNFAYPYFSQSMTEFWRRWHISLSTWFRDYVFIPLGGSRTTPMRTFSAVLVTFLLSGLWHGAAWRFVAWGGINGGAVAGASLFRQRDKPKRKPSETPGGERLIPTPDALLRMLGTFSLVCIGWVFFRAESMGEALVILRTIFQDAFSVTAYQATGALMQDDVLVTIVVLLLFVVAEWLQRNRECVLDLVGWAMPMRWATYSALIWLTIELMPSAGSQEFIYFRF